MNDNIEKEIADFLTGNWAILGIGNILRGDDSFGSVVVQKIRKRIGKSCIADKIFDGGIAPENYLGKLSALGIERLLIIDAAIFDSEAGALRFLDVGDFSTPLPTTHGPTNFSLFQMVLPDAKIKILSAMPQDTQIGAKMSDKMMNKADEVVSAIVKVVSSRS